MSAPETLCDQSRRTWEEKAKLFLETYLKGGPAFVVDIKLEAKRRGISWAGVRLARYILRVESKRTLKGQVWSLKG